MATDSPVNAAHKPIKKVHLVCKRSVYQKYVLDEKDPVVKRFLRSKNRSLRPMKKIHGEHYHNINAIEEFLKKLGVEFGLGFRHHINDLRGYKLIITIGGDGTFLRTAQKLSSNQLLLGINSNTKVSVGALCSLTHKNFRKKLKMVLSGHYEVRELPLIRIRLNGRILPTQATNDVLFTNISPAATSRYRLVFRGIQEEHKSSGLWISTGTGSTAAIHAAGGVKSSRDDKRLQFVVREPYQGIYNPYRLTQGFIAPGQPFKIINKMFDARLYIDGPATTYKVNVGDEITFELSPTTLKVVL